MLNLLSSVFKWIAAKLLGVGEWLEKKPEPKEQPKTIVDIAADIFEEQNKERAKNAKRFIKATKNREATMAEIESAIVYGHSNITDEMMKKFADAYTKESPERMMLVSKDGAPNPQTSQGVIPNPVWMRKSITITRDPGDLSIDDVETFKLVRAIDADIPKGHHYSPDDDENRDYIYNIKPLREQEVKQLRTRKIVTKGRKIVKRVAEIKREPAY